MPTVSIIIPTYNRSHYLQQAIDSALAQQFTDMEIIVVDDGSQDDTPDVVRAYTDTRVHYLRQDNSGRSAARNRGMKAATGRFISLLDDDDLHFPQKLTDQVAFLTAHPHLDAVASAGHAIDEHNRIHGAFQPWTYPLEITLPECIDQSGIPPSSLLFRRRSLDGMEYWFDPGIHYAEDNDFVIRFLLNGHRLAWLPHPVWGYRRYARRPGYTHLAPILSFHNVLERLFLRPNLPPTISEKKDEILSRSHTSIAGLAYLHHMIKLGQYHLKMAVDLDPSLLEGLPPRLTRTLRGFGHRLPTDEHQRYIESLCSNLPESLRHLHPFLLEPSQRACIAT